MTQNASSSAGPEPESTPKSTSKSNSTSTPKTPAGRNNYAAPHTPIASAKRPRASMDKNGNSNSNSNLMSPAGGAAGRDKVSLPPSTPLIAEDGEEPEVVVVPLTPQTPYATLTLYRSALSPMHPPRPLVIKEELHDEDQEEDSGSWVGRQVGTLFSPMLNLLSSEDNEEHEQEHEHEHDRVGRQGKGKGQGKDQDPGDLVKAAQDTTSLSTSQETISHDEDEEEDDDDEEEEPHPQDHQEEDHDDALVEDDHSSQGSLDEDEFNPYVFIKSLPAYEVVAPLRPPVALPPKTKEAPPISLVLDLDETLVHCTVEPVDDADLVFPVVFHGMTYQVHVRLRPHLFTFLEKIKGKYEVIVFTASQQVYADELLNLIDPDGKFIQHRMFRESCLAVEGNFLKDLNVLGRDLSKSVLVDNSPHAFGYQVDNGIPIESWYDDPNDKELLKLERFLRTLHGAKDVRSIVRKTFKTYQLIQNA